MKSSCWLQQSISFVGTDTTLFFYPLGTVRISFCSFVDIHTGMVPPSREVYAGNFDRGVQPRARLHCYSHRTEFTGSCSRPSGGQARSVYRPRASTVSPRDESPVAKQPPKLYILYYYNLTYNRYA